MSGTPITEAAANANDSLIGLLNGIRLILYLITLIPFLIWVYRAYRNLSSLEAGQLTYSPGWAVGGFFIPFLNLVRPYLVVREIWQASDPNPDLSDLNAWRGARSTPLIGWWWILCIVTGIASRISQPPAYSQPTLDTLMNAAWFGIVYCITYIAAAILLLFIIKGVAARQEQRFALLTGTVASSEWPPYSSQFMTGSATTTVEKQQPPYLSASPLYDTTPKADAATDGPAVNEKGA